MTHEEIEIAWKRLREIAVMEKEGTTTDRETTIVKLLQDLALDVGVWRSNLISNSNAEKMQLFQNIHQALQTASMIDACRTAARNHEVALRAQKSAWVSQWISVFAMLGTVTAAIAAWVAATRP
jgi:hypothetical protein